jgi:hypothetical protein
MTDAAQEAVLLAEELERRRAGDPLYLFKPHDKQRPFIESVLGDPGSENWLLAANRAGKSDAGAYCGAQLARFGAPDAKFVRGQGSDIAVKDRATSGWVSGLTFSLVRDSIQPKYFDNGYVPPGQPHQPFIPQREVAHWDPEGQVLKLKNGSLVGFKSADSGSSKYQAVEKDWVHMDEEHPKRIYEEIVIRVGARPLRFFCTATLLPPEGIVGGVTWIFPDIIRPWQRGERKFTKIFTASIFDNPHIPRTEIERLEAIYPPGSLQWRIRLNGELLPGLSGARAYPAFDRLLNVRTQAGIHQRRPLAWCWDFNVEPLITTLGQRDGPLFRIYRELVMPVGSIPEMVEMFRLAHPMHQAEIQIYGDATGKARSTQSRHDNYTMIRNLMMNYPAPVRLVVPESNPPQTSRINAVNLACKNEQGQINLEVDPSCSELIQDMEEVLLDEKGGIKKTSNRKDPYFKRTHVSDGMGYWIWYEAPVRILSSSRPTGAIKSPSYNFGR